MGYTHMVARGQKGYNGVAIFSKIPMEEVAAYDYADLGHARHVAGKLENGVTGHNFYVPAGGDEPNPDVNDKFAHKLQFIDEMTRWSETLDEPSILVGDLNIAPHPDDVWDHKKLLKVVSHTPVETDAMLKLIEAHGWHDVMREYIPLPEKMYSWWSYRARDWSAADKGRRLDHVWTSPALKGTAVKMEVLRGARGWEKPSDHAPVLVDFNF